MIIINAFITVGAAGKNMRTEGQMGLQQSLILSVLWWIDFKLLIKSSSLVT